MPQTNPQPQKWADFGICEVHFNVRHTHIESVKLRPDLGSGFGDEQLVARSGVVYAIRQLQSFCTIRWNSSGWIYGAPVRIFIYNGEAFIKTVADGTPCDNLDNLPEF